MIDLSKKFWLIAEDIMQLIYKETGSPVIVYDENGIIRKAIDRSRIGTPHAGAQKILKGEVDEYAVTAAEASQNPFVREGYSCPILIDGVAVGCFGITGKLEVTKPLARVATMMITARLGEIKKQEALRASEIKYRNIVENSIEGIYQASPEGRFLMANSAMANICGYDSPEQLCREIDDIGRQLYVNQDDRIQFKKAINACDRVKDFETRFYKNLL